jgi:RNA polymerase sigma-B factor
MTRRRRRRRAADIDVSEPGKRVFSDVQPSLEHGDPSGATTTTRSPRARTDEYAHLAPYLHELAATAADDPRRAILRDHLVAGYLPVVRHIARRFAGRGEPLEDLEQAGSIGLIGAVDRFDPGRGLDFLSFAVPTITGSIRRHFRDHAWSMRVPRRLKDIQSSLNGAIGPLAQELKRAPRPSEIAAWLGVPLDEVLQGLEAQQAYRADSIDHLDTDGNTPLSDRIGHADAELENVEYRETLGPLLDTLTERERTIVLLRFFGNQTQTQIAETVGLSQMHVSRLLTQILRSLRDQMADDA